MGGMSSFINNNAEELTSGNRAKEASYSISNKYINPSVTYDRSADGAYNNKFDGLNSDTKLGPSITGKAPEVKSPSLDIASTLNKNINTSTNSTSTTLNGINANSGLGKTLSESQDSTSQTIDNALKANDITGKNMSQTFSNSEPQVFSV